MEFNLIPDRYDGHPTVPYIVASNVLSDVGRVFLQAPLGDDDEFAIYFEGDSAKIDESILECARSLLQAVGYLDNRIQEACAAQCRVSGLHPRNYEGDLAYITIFGESALLHYFGSHVNTEWDELVKLEDGKWTYSGTVEP